MIDKLCLVGMGLALLVLASVILWPQGGEQPGTITLMGHEQSITVPRLCQEDEVLDWTGDDIRGCVHYDELCGR